MQPERGGSAVISKMHHRTSSLFLPLLSLFLAAPLGGTSRSNFGQFHSSYRPREGSRTPAQKPQHVVRASSHKVSRPARMFRIPSVFEKGLEGGPTRRWAALLDDGRGVRVARNAARTEQVYLVARARRTRRQQRAASAGAQFYLLQGAKRNLIISWT